MQRAQVVLERAVERAHAARCSRGRRRLARARASISASVASDELEAVAAEELDPVVAVRVVRGAR